MSGAVIKRKALLVPVALVSLGGVAVAGGGGPEGLDESIREVLVTGWVREAWAEEKVISELAVLGPVAVPNLFEIHSGQDFSPWEGEGVVLSFEQGPERGGELAGLALRRMSQSSIVSYLGRTVGPRSSQDVRLSAIGLYASVGGADELEPLMTLAGSFSEEDLNTPTLRTRIPCELAAMFERVPDAALVGVTDLEETPAHLRKPLFEAFLTTEHPVAIDVLSAMIGRDPSFDARAIARLAELGKSYPWRLGAEESLLAVNLLADTDWRVRRAACVLAANWRQLATFEELVRMSDEDSQPSVRRAAGWALHEISGTRLELDSSGWNRWFDTQVESWEREFGGLTHGLQSEDPGQVSQAIRRCTQFPLYRDQAAPLVATVLFDHPGLADTVASVLISLDSRQVTPILIELLETSDDERARQIIWMTLKRLTGRELRIDDPAWTSLLVG